MFEFDFDLNQTITSDINEPDIFIPFAPMVIMPLNMKTTRHVQDIVDTISNTLNDNEFSFAFSLHHSEWNVTYVDLMFDVHIYKVAETGDEKIVEVQRLRGDRHIFNIISQKILTAVNNIPERVVYVEPNNT